MMHTPPVAPDATPDSPVADEAAPVADLPLGVHDVPTTMVRRSPGRVFRIVALLGTVAWLGLSWDDSLVPVLVTAGIWSSAAVGLGMILGRAGQISLGQGALVGLSAYVVMKASAEGRWPAEANLVLGMLAGVAGAALAAPVLRLRGLNLAVATLAFGLIFERLVTSLRSLTGGGTGLGGIRPLRILGANVTSEEAFLVVTCTSTTVVVLFAWLTLRGRFGRALDAIRTDEEMAAAHGIAVARVKIIAWLIAGGLAGLSGVWYAYYNRYLSPEQFGLVPSVDLLSAVIVGGAGHPAGPVLGEFVLNVVPEKIAVSDEFRSLIAPVLLVVFASLFPRGLAGIRR